MLNKQILLCLSLILILSPISYSVDFIPQGDINGKSIRSIINFLDINATNFYGNGSALTNIVTDWNNLQNYPSACPTGTFITQLNDSVTCTAPTAADVDAGTFPSGNYIFQNNLTTTDLLISGTIYKTADALTKIVFGIAQIDLHAGDVKMMSLDNEAFDKLYVNPDSNDIDFIVEGDNDANLIFSDAGNDRVGIGTFSPTQKLHVQGNSNITGNLTIGGGLISWNGTHIIID